MERSGGSGGGEYMIHVRAGLPGDADAVTRTMLACTRDLRAVYVPITAVQCTLDGAGPTGSRLVAVDPVGTVVGVGEFVVRGASAVYVQGLAVASANRRQGVAAALLEHVAAYARKSGIPMLEVATIKETGNLDVFWRLGFRVVAESVSKRFCDVEGGNVHELTLRRPISARALAG